MRLLNARTHTLEEFAGDVPRYAILSHTWGSEEVSFQDLNNNDGVERKQGYRKIRLACEQAVQEYVQYVWVDTCCIDKSSSAELSEAIHSMWTYYRQAHVCYVFLDDVSGISKESKTSKDSSDKANPETSTAIRDSLWEEFCHSKWFRRGWTLQELIAPLNIVFYSKSWLRIGTRNGPLRDLIKDITKIPAVVLESEPDLERRLRHCSVAKRMSWAATRETTRVEDEAYCLLGIFDVNMPMLYGEGRKAFKRLQEEIIKTSTDHSILARDVANGGTLFAASPTEFHNGRNIESCAMNEPMESYSMTNRGLMITLPVKDFTIGRTHYIDAALNCTEDGKTLCLKLQQLTTESVVSTSDVPTEYAILTGPPRSILPSGQLREYSKRTIVTVPRTLVENRNQDREEWEDDELLEAPVFRSSGIGYRDV